MNPLRSWVPALRLARRETVRGRGRSILVLVMIALPVLGVTAADVVIRTAEVSGGEALERRLGAADALVSVEQGIGEVRQGPDPDLSGWSASGGDTPAPDLDALANSLGRPVTGVELRGGVVRVVTDGGVADVEVLETALDDDVTDGLFRITEGRVPGSPDETVVNGVLAERGFALGDPLELHDGTVLTVVGIGESTTARDRTIAVSEAGAFGLPRSSGTTWLVDAGGDVTWDDVRTLNGVGARVLSRAVLLDPPSEAELYPDFRPMSGPDQSLLAVAALIAVMALMEVVLLAGPAFAVIARRMQRSLALMSAGGATPSQARRVVLATGLVLGSLGAALGVGLGLVVAWLSLPLVQRFSDTYLGPWDVPWAHLMGIAALGLLSALLAAVVPAWIASRQDVVAVLAGRRGEGRPSVRSPVLGVLLVGAGVTLSTWGAVARAPFAIAGAAIITVLGMVLLVPVTIALVARAARGLPLATRYAVRDAARHRTRTVPAVAAVAATVAGVVALGIAATSNDALAEATYSPQLEAGQASLTTADGSSHDWEAYAAVARQHLPGAEVSTVVGVPEGGRRWTEIRFEVAGKRHVLSMYGTSIGSAVPVATDGRLVAGATGLDEDQHRAAEAVLARGGVLVYTDRGLEADEATVRLEVHGRQGRRARTTVPAYVVDAPGGEAPVIGVLSEQVVEELAVGVRPVGLLVDGVDITDQQETDVAEAVGGIDQALTFYVERGYQDDASTVILLVVLWSLGAVLMLGGTLTATFLSLSDARPDLATLAAVGAAPRTRRAVAASYALVIGTLGSVLGVLVGFVPGVAITYPLTGRGWQQDLDPNLPGHFLEVPWLLVGSLVVVLPLLTAAIVGATTRSRLPLVVRID